MKVIKNIKKAYDIKYVDCEFGIEGLDKCQINGVSSTAQTIRNLPFLNFKRTGFEWSPRINLETGKILCWPIGIKAIVNFQVTSHCCTYTTKTYEYAFSEDKAIPSFFQLDIVDNEEMISLNINSRGYIENWPSVENIVTELMK